MQTKKISLVGLGKLGLPLALSFASRKIKVLGVEISRNLVDSITKRKAPYFEPDLQTYLTQTAEYLEPTLSHKRAIAETDVTIILVATPSDRRGNFSNRYLLSAARTLGRALKRSGKAYHVFVVSSTVMPGSLYGQIIPALEKASGRKLNEGFGLCYVPDFVAIGKVIKDFLNPDFILVGSDKPEDGKLVANLYSHMVQNRAPVVPTSLVSAELIKVALNNYLTLKISYANLLANLCERIPGANVDEVTNAIGLDQRIGRKYLKGGLRFGGTCFPRDTRALSVLVKKYQVEGALVTGMNKTNVFQDRNLYRLITTHLRTHPQLAIVGLSFKPDTAVMEEAASTVLLDRLLAEHADIKPLVYDPLAMPYAENYYGSKLSYAKSLTQVAKRADLIVILNPDAAYLDIAKLPLKRKAVVIDCWRLLFAHPPQSCTYIALGVHPA